MAVRPFYENDSVRYGSLGPLSVSVYLGNVTREALEHFDTMQHTLVQSHGRIATLSIIRQTTMMLKVDDSVRKFGIELGVKCEDQVHTAAIVIQTKGLAAVMVRTFFSGFFMLSRSKMETRIFSDLPEALAWMKSKPGNNPLASFDVSLDDLTAFAQTR